MTREEIIEGVIERIRPAIHADGGDIELVGLEGEQVRIRLSGACAGCPSAEMTLRVGVEAALRRALPGLRVVPEVDPPMVRAGRFGGAETRS